MRIQFVVNNFPAAASPVDGIFNLRAAQALHSLGHEVRVVRIVPHMPPWLTRWQRYRTLPQRYDVDGISVRVIRGLMGPKRWAIGTLAWQTRAAMHAELASFCPDVIHVHGLLPAGVLGLTSHVPLVLTAHGSEAYALPWRRRGLEKLARHVLDRPQAVVAVSEFVAGHLRALGRHDVGVVYNGADEVTFAPRDRQVSRAILELDPSRPAIAFAGHVMVSKGILELIAAAAQLASLRPILLVAGTGESQGQAQALARASGVEVRFLGRLDHHDLAIALAACDVFALPSHAEGLPTAICEAMMMGRAVVATRVGGVAEIVRDGETGRVVSPRDIAQLAGAIGEVLRQPATRAAFEMRARAFALEHLSWRRNALRYEALYGNAIAAVCAGKLVGGALPVVETVPPSSTP